MLICPLSGEILYILPAVDLSPGNSPTAKPSPDDLQTSPNLTTRLDLIF